jgi:hypothetical protein
MKPIVTGFAMQNRAVQFILGSEVAKDDGLRHTGCLSDLFRRSSLEPALREKGNGRLQDLLAAGVGGHAPRVVTIEQFVDQ